jgi:hypothetical protein
VSADGERRPAIGTVLPEKKTTTPKKTSITEEFLNSSERERERNKTKRN